MHCNVFFQIKSAADSDILKSRTEKIQKKFIKYNENVKIDKFEDSAVLIEYGNNYAYELKFKGMFNRTPFENSGIIAVFQTELDEKEEPEIVGVKCPNVKGIYKVNTGPEDLRIL